MAENFRTNALSSCWKRTRAYFRVSLVDPMTQNNNKPMLLLPFVCNHIYLPLYTQLCPSWYMFFHYLSVRKQKHLLKRKTGSVSYCIQHALRKEISLQKEDEKTGKFYLQLMPLTTERAISFVPSSYTCLVVQSPENTLSSRRNRQEHQR